MDKNIVNDSKDYSNRTASNITTEPLTKEDLHEIDQQEGHMNNGSLGGNFAEDKNIDINKNLENSPTH